MVINSLTLPKDSVLNIKLVEFKLNPKILQYVDNTAFTLHTKYVMGRKWKELLSL